MDKTEIDLSFDVHFGLRDTFLWIEVGGNQTSLELTIQDLSKIILALRETSLRINYLDSSNDDTIEYCFQINKDLELMFECEISEHHCNLLFCAGLVIIVIAMEVSDWKFTNLIDFFEAGLAERVRNKD